ncbi:MAG TPA: dienelactone hydrolase family protein [Jatrophihabitans sp.]|nr:dienelactone hydrolase family protein [Jatrophihabitans sp.]
MTVVLLHSILGQRQAVRAMGAALAARGSDVIVADLYGDGREFDDSAEAAAYAERIGERTLLARARAAAARAAEPVVYAGFSAGAGIAERLAVGDRRARGLVLMHGALPVEELGVARWPRRLPVQTHFADGDPYRDPARFAAFTAAVRSSGARLTEYDYPGSGHLFGDHGLPDEYDAISARRMLDRVARFVAGMAASPRSGVRAVGAQYQPPLACHCAHAPHGVPYRDAM